VCPIGGEVLAHGKSPSLPVAVPAGRAIGFMIGDQPVLRPEILASRRPPGQSHP
jgi:hypothetical protein